MTRPATFFANNNIGNQIDGLRVPVMKLSMDGYSVLETRSSSSKEQAQIMIDRPIEGEEFSVSPDGNFGYLIQWNCRIYWRIN